MFLFGPFKVPICRSLNLECNGFVSLANGVGAEVGYRRPNWVVRATSLFWGRLIVAPRSATVRARVAKWQQLKETVNFLECPTCHNAIDLVKGESGAAIVHTLCLGQVERNGIRATDLGKSFGVEQVIVAYKASTLKQSIMSDLLEWLVR